MLGLGERGAISQRGNETDAKDAKQGGRLCKMIDRIGLEPFKAALA